MTYFVSGITGHVGGAAARALLEQGRSVRALARDPSKAAAFSERGVDVRRGDLLDAAALAEAMEGVEAAFLMMPPVPAPAPGFPEAKAFAASYREALRSARPPRVVLLSSVGAEKTHGLGLITSAHMLEQALAESAPALAFVRAAGFLDNYVYALDACAATGVFDTFLTPTDRAVPMVASGDIGAEVARLVSGEWSGQRIVELGSPWSPDDLARAIGDAIGRPVRARTIPRERWSAVLEAQGMPSGTTGAFEEMEDGVNSGWIAFGAPGAERVQATITPARFFADAQRARRSG